MRKLIYVLILGGTAYATLAFTDIENFLPEGRLRKLIEIPGSAVYGMDIAGVDLRIILGVGAALLLVLMSMYTYMAK